MNSDVTHSGVLENLDINLPPLPHTFLMAMALSRESDRVTIDEVVALIQNDPAIVARVLRLVNSAYYAMRKEVTSINRAVVVLGPQAILGLVMSMSLVDMKEHMEIAESSAFQRLVQHSIAVGHLAGRIVAMSKLTEDMLEMEHDFPNEAFMLGLLHDFGKIVLFYNFPEKAITFYETPQKDIKTDVELLAREAEVFGVDHVEAGKYLMQELNFVSTVKSAVAYHHSYDGGGDYPPGEQYLLNVVVAINLLANAIGLSFNHPISRGRFMDDPFWDQLLDQNIFEVEDKEALIDELFALEERAKVYLSEVL